MKTIFKTLLSSFVFASLLASANATPITACPVNIPGGTLQPGDKLILKLDKLPRQADAAYYNISCDIESSGYTAAHPPIIKVWGSNSESILVNGKALVMGQASINKSPSKLEVKNAVVSKQANGVIVPSETSILNLDDGYAVIVGGCVANLVGN